MHWYLQFRMIQSSTITPITVKFPLNSKLLWHSIA
ncbi:hypothetical protein RSOL_363960 [Rhizoctonia solani AG-3 Rhs1AP]|uniref:Uncharacterized protein n=1 Tax=Rhizoctonia solani AG-3 Rhs1AP TaxID=1086054 RepID=X8JAW9_9AGAM|nr:hypothetical protein RSOL_363960 [Rhizoctonia solani AG-3 Rhs1AP]